MGNSILILAKINNTPIKIEKFHKEISEKYNVTSLYRKCDVVIDNYSCLDIFGEDINNLFFMIPQLYN